MTNTIKKYLPISLILLVSIFMRFHRLKDFFPFTIDEEYLSQLAWTIVHDFHVIWIGVSAGSTGFYLGPGYIYVTALLLWIGKGNPLALAYWVSFIGVATVFSIWWIVKQTVSRRAGIIAGALYGFSYFISLYDRRFWPPLVGFMLLWMAYFLWKAYKNSVWFIPFFFLLGVSMHMHLSLFIVVPLALWILLKTRKQLRPFTIFASIACYIVAVSPLIVYDFVHNFDNIRAPFLLLSNASGASHNITARVSVILMIIGKSMNPTTATLTLGIVLTGLLSLGIFAKRKVVPAFIYLSLAVSIMLMMLFLAYPGRVEQYYLVGLLPFITILFAYIFDTFVPSKPLIFLLSTFLISNMYTLIVSKPLFNSYAQKETVITEVKKITKEKPVLLVTTSDYLYDGGWHFLFTQARVPVTAGSSSEMFSWIYTQYYSPPKKATYKVTLENNNKGVTYKIENALP